MSFCVLPVFLAFILNRFSIRFFTMCRCTLGFTPYSASLLFGLSLVAILVKHPELYPCWLRRVNEKIMFFYELFASLIFIEIGYCFWNSLETVLFYKIPAYLEEHWSTIGEYYIRLVESPVGVSFISNLLALTLLLITLHITRVCNFNLLFKPNGLHKFFADAGLTSKVCRHHKDSFEVRQESDCNLPELSPTPSPPNCTPPPSCMAPPVCSNRPSTPPLFPRMKANSASCSHGSKMLRSGKKFY